MRASARRHRSPAGQQQRRNERPELDWHRENLGSRSGKPLAIGVLSYRGFRSQPPRRATGCSRRSLGRQLGTDGAGTGRGAGNHREFVALTSVSSRAHAPRARKTAQPSSIYGWRRAARGPVLCFVFASVPSRASLRPCVLARRHLPRPDKEEGDGHWRLGGVAARPRASPPPRLRAAQGARGGRPRGAELRPGSRRRRRQLRADLLQWPQRPLRRRAAVHPVRAVGGRVAEPGAPARRGGGVLLHGPAPAAVHGRVVPGGGAGARVPGDRRARVRARRPPRRVRVPLRRALPRGHRLPHPGGGQPRQALPGHQRRPRPRRGRRARRGGLREAALRRARRARHPAHHVAPEPRRARVRVGQRRARVRRRGRLRAVGRRGRRRRVPGAREDAQCQWPAHGAGPLHLLLLRPCHFPDALQLHEGKEKVLQGARHMLHRLHPELRIHGDPWLPHVRRRRPVPGDAESAGREGQLEAGHLHDADQPVLQVRPDGDTAGHGGRGEAARRQQEVVHEHAGQDPPRRQHGRRRARGALLRPPHGARGLAPQRHGLDAAPLRLLPQDLRRGTVRQGGGRADRRDHRAWFPCRRDGDVLFSKEDYSRVLKKPQSTSDKYLCRRVGFLLSLKCSLVSRDQQISTIKQLPDVVDEEQEDQGVLTRHRRIRVSPCQLR